MYYYNIGTNIITATIQNTIYNNIISFRFTRSTRPRLNVYYNSICTAYLEYLLASNDVARGRKVETLYHTKRQHRR